MLPDMPQPISVETYHRLIETGILTDEDNLELLNGWLVLKPKKTPRRVWVRRQLCAHLEHSPLVGWHVNSHGAFTTPTSEPEPDLMVVRGEIAMYSKRHPFAAEIGLVVEVDDALLARFRVGKRTLYAASLIPHYWIVNIVERQIEAYTDPTGPAEAPDYRQRRDYGVLDEIPLVIDGIEVARFAVRDLLP